MLNSAADRNTVLRAAKQLTGSKTFIRVYIACFLTKDELVEGKATWEQRKILFEDAGATDQSKKPQDNNASTS